MDKFNDEYIKAVAPSPFKEINEYQQRLDKVLSKFEDKRLYLCGATNIYKTYDINGNVIFYLDNDNGYAVNALTISLNTVESLLKDLEGNNGNRDKK